MPDKVRPITPGRVVKEKKKNFPNEVNESFYDPFFVFRKRR
jgi:hypothetical protein